MIKRLKNYIIIFNMIKKVPKNFSNTFKNLYKRNRKKLLHFLGDSIR